MNGKHKCNEKYRNREMAARRVVKSKGNDVPILRNLMQISLFFGERARWIPNKANTTPSS